MKAINKQGDKVTLECSINDIKTIIYVLLFAQGGVEADIERDMLKIVGVLEGVIDE